MYYQYDLKEGILHNWKFYLFPIVITMIGCISFLLGVKKDSELGLIDRNVYFPDVLFYLWKGDKPNSLYGIGEFHFPFLWIIYQIVLAFIIGRYPTSELYNGHGAYVLIKGGSRFRWLQSKFAVTLLNCILYYIFVVLTAMVFSSFSGISMQFEVKPSSSELLLTSDNTISDLTLYSLLLLPIMTSIALSFFQLMITLLTNALIGFTVVIGICGASIYFESLFFFANCSLLNRNIYFTAGSISNQNAVIVLTSIIIASAVISHIYFTRIDIIEKGKNV